MRKIDSTNADVPQPGIQLSGDATRLAAIKRLQKKEKKPVPEKPGGLPLTPGPTQSV